jgi:hypothetical protein
VRRLWQDDADETSLRSPKTSKGALAMQSDEAMRQWPLGSSLERWAWEG